MDNYQGGIHQTAYSIIHTLAELGFGRVLPDNRLYNVRFKRIVQTPGWWAFEVDTRDLPPAVRANRMVAKNTVHELTIRLGKQVHRLNTHGVTYAVQRRIQRKNPLPELVGLGDPRNRPAGEYMIPIGQSVRGAVWRELAGNYLVGGTTQYGKTLWINGVLFSLVCNETPERLQLVLVDPKGIEFTFYRSCPHMAFDVATRQDEAEAAVGWVLDEMEHRREAFRSAGARSLAEYNRLAPTPLPRLLVVVDEVTHLTGSGKFEDLLISLVSQCVAFGIHVLVAAQNPKAETLNTLARGNFATRISFYVTEWNMSQVILNERGAEKLAKIPGRMLAKLDGDLIELQAFYSHPAWVQTFGWDNEPKPLSHAGQLSDLEREMVTYAIEVWDGKMPQEQLYHTFKDRISHHAVVNMLREWESRGWLENNGNGRQGTDKLRGML
jgi:hypothetical protein